jgi:cell division septum initiation protein DivIVA
VDIEDHLNRIENLLAEGRSVPLSSLVMVDRGELYGLLEGLRADLPEELRQARWIVKEREELLAAASREAAQVRADATREAQRLVEDEEVVRAAQREADRLVEEARERARTLRLEAEDYVDAKLATFQAVLERTMQSVARGRDRLRGRVDGEPAEAGDAPAATPHTAGGEGEDPPQFFDHETWR